MKKDFRMLNIMQLQKKKRLREGRKKKKERLKNLWIKQKRMPWLKKKVKINKNSKH